MHSHSSACAHRPRPGRTRVAVSWPVQRLVVAETLVVSQPKVGHVVGLSCRIVAAGAVSQRAVSRSWLPCRGPAAHCIAIQCPASTAFWSQYTKVYCNTQSSATNHLSHNTLTCIAIQFHQSLHTLAIQFFPIAIHLPSLPHAAIHF